jgi:sugar-specific transcriptional regulator TrmB
LTALENDIDTLTQLGLTPTQAKVYIVLVKYEKASVQTIAKVAQIDRSDSYRVIRQLQNLRLTEKILGTPSSYRAMPLTEGISLLLNQKKHEFRLLQNNAKKLLRKNGPLLKADQSCADQDQFVIVPPLEMHYRKFQDSLGKARESLDSVFSWADLKSTIEDGAPAHKEALKKGAKLRYIVEKQGVPKDHAATTNVLSSVGSFKVRFVQKIPQVWFGIVDKEELFVVVCPKPNPMKSACLWSCNSGIIEIFQSYFDAAWQNARELTSVE